MKKSLFYIVFIFATTLHSQSIVINMSIRYDYEPDILVADSLVPHAKLCIKYTNLSDSCYYFLKPVYFPTGLPFILNEFLINIPLSIFMLPAEEKLRRFVYNHEDYTNQSCTIKMGGPYTVCQSTFIMDEPACKYAMSSFYEHLEKMKLLSVEQDVFETPEILDDRMRSGRYKSFLYLKPYENHTETVDLIGFQLIGGHYTFKLECIKSAPASQASYPFWAPVPLPEQAGEYYLYEGNFKTEDFFVKFVSWKHEQEAEVKTEIE